MFIPIATIKIKFKHKGLNTKVNLRYNVTLNEKCQGHKVTIHMIQSSRSISPLSIKCEVGTTPKTYLKHKDNLKYHVTLSKKSQGHHSVEVMYI